MLSSLYIYVYMYKKVRSRADPRRQPRRGSRLQIGTVVFFSRTKEGSFEYLQEKNLGVARRVGSSLALRRYCNHQSRMVYGIQKGGRGGASYIAQ